MTEPVSSTGVTLSATAVAATGWWAGMDAGVVIGAFAGAMFFVISSSELKLLARGGYFFVSFVFGMLCAPYAAEVITLAIPGTKSHAPVSIGALLSAAVAIKLLLAATTKNMSGRFLAGLGGLLAAAVVKQKETNRDD